MRLRGHYSVFYFRVLDVTNHFIAKEDFRVFLPEVYFVEKSGTDADAYNSHQIKGVMSTSRLDRQGERVLAKGLDITDFLDHGHFNDNHSPDTSAIVGYPEHAAYSNDIVLRDGSRSEGWICSGYVLKGTKRADDIWELAKALAQTPNKRLGFSIEGKVLRRKNNVVEKALIRHVAITNCPVNTDATWDVLAKSFCDEDIARKSLAAGYGFSPGTHVGGAALGRESLDRDGDERGRERKKKRDKGLKIVMRSLGFAHDPDEIRKAVGYVLDLRPDFDEEAAAELVHYMIMKGAQQCHKTAG